MTDTVDPNALMPLEEAVRLPQSGGYLTEAKVHELSNGALAYHLPIDVLRETARRVAVAAEYSDA